MKNGKAPNPNTIHPIPGYENEIYVKPTVTCSDLEKMKRELRTRLWSS